MAAVTAAASLAATSSAAGLDRAAIYGIAQRNQGAMLRDFVRFVSIPNDAAVAGDIPKNVDWLLPAFTKAGFTVQKLENGDHPMVFAQYPGATTDRKTVLIYMHFDGQPVVPAMWHQSSPWTPTLKQKGADGSWHEMPTDQLYGATVDPEWRLFARAVADDKGPIMMLLSAMTAMHQAGVQPAVNVKVILDSEEEKNSPSLGRIIDQHADLLKADSLLVVDGPMHASNNPTLVFGNRGVETATLTVYGAKKAMHSGHFGNYVPNPAFELARLLASMKDDDGRVTIKGYYDGVAITDATRKVLAAVPDDQAGFMRENGFSRPEKVGANVQEALQYPSLNVRGMQSAQIGEKAATIVPDTAVAEIDVRTVPEVDPDRLFRLIADHIRAQGFHLTTKAPTDAERAQYPKIASFVTHEGEDAHAAITPLDAPISRWVESALRDSFGAEPVRIRMMGGTVPTGAMANKLKMPFVIMPLANSDDNQHTHDENLRLGNFQNGVKSFIAVLTQPYTAGS